MGSVRGSAAVPTGHSSAVPTAADCLGVAEMLHTALLAAADF